MTDQNPGDPIDDPREPRDEPPPQDDSVIELPPPEDERPEPMRAPGADEDANPII